MTSVNFKDEITNSNMIEDAKKVAIESFDNIKGVQEKNEILEAKVKWYEEQLRLAAKQKFGPKSEKIPLDQLSIFNEIENEEDPSIEEPNFEEITYKRRKKKRTQLELFENLETEIIEYKLDENDQFCPKCDNTLHVMSKRITKEIEIIPARVIVKEHVGYIYSCRHCENNELKPTIINAAMPKRALPGSMASSSIIAYIMNEKYQNAMPLYRLEKSFRSLDVNILRNTMSNWLMKSSKKWLEPIYNHLHKALLKEDILNVDETTVQVVKQEGKKKAKHYMWVYRSGRFGSGIVLYDYSKTRAGSNPVRFLGDYNGYLLVDGYAGYNVLKNTTRVACLAHIRRKFKESMDSAPNGQSKGSASEEGLTYCQKLYKIEKSIKDKTPSERYEIRLNESRLIMDDFLLWLKKTKKKALPQSKLGKAIFYALGQFGYLENIFLDGRLEIDNNRAERSIKPFVVGRKNFLFMMTKNGAKSSAIIYSIVETAKENNLKVYEYLKYLFEELPKYDELTDEVLESHMPWSPNIPKHCKMSTSSKNTETQN